MNVEPTGEFQLKSQIVLVLVGLIGSGKSTFANALEEHIPIFRRCNQDDLGDRRRVEKLARESLSEGLCVCVDRTNVDESQRLHWINIAKEKPGTLIWCLVFDVPLDVIIPCHFNRELVFTAADKGFDHPTIKSPEQGLAILRRFASEFQAPSINEGFDRILYLSSFAHPSPEYSKSELSALLERINSSVAAPSSISLDYNRNTSSRVNNTRGRDRRHNYNKYPTQRGRTRNIRSYFQSSHPYQQNGRLPESHTYVNNYNVPASSTLSSSAMKSKNGSVENPIVLE